MTYTRRQLLRRGGLATLGVAGGVVLLPSPPPDQQPVRPEGLSTPSDRQRSFVTEEYETPYALWMYSRHADDYVATSPINVVITLAHTERTFEDVMAVLWEAGWQPWPVEYVRYAYNAHTDAYERTHQTAAQSRFGAFGRFHVRAWDFEGFISIQVHEDSRPKPSHIVRSHERGKWLLEHLFHEAGWDVSPDAARFDNAAGPDHEGDITVIIG